MVCQYKNFENRLTFGQDIDNDKEGSFFSETQCRTGNWAVVTDSGEDGT